MLRQIVASIRALVVFTIILGIVYPLAVFGVGRLMPARADGSLIRQGNQVVGSSLIGQQFPGAEWFHSRPSASQNAGDVSGGTNLGPTDPEVNRAIAERQAHILTENPSFIGDVPADALTASASGLDPDISPTYAWLQVDRVAEARRLPVEDVQSLVARNTRGRFLGFLGEPRVNVTMLNFELASIH